ncbi:MAG TPA: toll/interleukin-1 receptor domain-containing protein [Thermoanaerobaculia bacterium]
MNFGMGGASSPGFSESTPLRKGRVFFSYIEEETEMAELLKEPFLPSLVDVFDFNFVERGEDWFPRMTKALLNTDVLLVLCSKTSLRSRWINFETGVCWARGGVPIIPICHSGFDPETVPRPFQDRNGVMANQETQLRRFYEGMARLFRWEELSRAYNLPKSWLSMDYADLAVRVRKLEEQYKSKPRTVDRDHSKYCSMSMSFQESRAFIADARPHNPGDRSDLWYMVINTKLFKDVRKKLIEVLEEACDSRGSEGKLYDVSVWSLLGAAELMARFRADMSTAAAIKERLLTLLKPAVEDQEVDEGEDTDGTFLESTITNPEGLSMFNVAQEMVPVKTSRGSVFHDGALIQKSAPKEDMRSVKAFINLHFEKGLKPHEKSNIISQLHGFTSTAEALSITQENGNDPVHIVIEAHYPCGHFGQLRELSSALESVLRQRLVKETYLAYDVVNIKGDTPC